MLGVSRGKHLIFPPNYEKIQNHRGRQDLLFFDLKSNQSLDLFLLILDLRSIF
jgi:hypothetical protein